MWMRLFQLIDKRETFTIPDAAKSISYLNSDTVTDDNQAYGSSFIKVLFEAFKEQSMQASNNRGWEIYNWKEKDQKSSANNVYIWRAVQNAVHKTLPVEGQSEKLKHFINILLS